MTNDNLNDPRFSKDAPELKHNLTYDTNVGSPPRRPLHIYVVMNDVRDIIGVFDSQEKAREYFITEDLEDPIENGNLVVERYLLR